MKKPLINLTAIERVDAVPLRKALEIYRKAAGEIVAARVRETALKKEIEDFLANVSPDDDKALHIISGKKIQAEILPNLIRKVENNIDREALPSLLREAASFRDGLRRFYGEAHDAIATQIAAIFRPYFAEPAADRDGVDRALAVARQTDDCRRFMDRLNELDNPPHTLSASGVTPSLSQPHEVTNLVAAAEALLALAERN